MGDKIESKKFANAARVSTVPGFLGVIEDAAQAEKIAAEVGYPVMIKASAGGGGKGMRIAWNDAPSCSDGFERARSEAKSSFGDDRVFIEKFIVDPRHIEIQVLADAHGNCDLSRRARMLDPAPQPEGGRGGAVAVSSTRRRGARWASRRWRSLGRSTTRAPARSSSSSTRTATSIFLEMNTRLQVEHPVTELVTGIDLVEQMIRIAAGERLAIRAGGRQARRLGDREPALRRGSVPQLPAVDRPADALPAAGRKDASATSVDPQRHRRHRRRRRSRFSTIR